MPWSGWRRVASHLRIWLARCITLSNVVVSSLAFAWPPLAASAAASRTMSSANHTWRCVCSPSCESVLVRVATPGREMSR